MIVTDMLAWWFTRGWFNFVLRLGDRLRSTLDFFSFGALARTLFAPFRQISADASGTSLSDRFRALLDRLFSRMIGAVVRIFLMIVGLALLVIELAISLVLIVGWPLVPLMPVACVFLAIAQVML